MKWEKKGLICANDTLKLDWYKKNSMVPVPYLINDGRLRIFFTMCDSANIGRIGYVDVNPENPSEILGYSKQPVVDIGRDGAFDDNGVVTASIMKDGENLYLYYSGYQSCVKVPYMIFAGVAVSRDNGETFKKISTDVPILERVDGEIATRCVPFVMNDEKVYRIWYTADVDDGWIQGPEKKVPLYDLKYLVSESPVEFPRVRGETAVGLQNSDEHGIAKCTVWKENGLYKCIYSIRSLSKKYRLGYGESTDGVSFVRMDENVGIDVSESGWDSEMIAFAERIQIKDRVYLFYSGNHYGMGGIGYAELTER